MSKERLKASAYDIVIRAVYHSGHNLLRVVSPNRYEWNYKIDPGVEIIEIKDDFI